MLRSQAARMRSHISQGLATPAVFRAELARVPPGDRDAWLDHVCELEGIPDDGPELPRGCVPYLPCSVATLLDMVAQAGVTHEDVFVDVGSGLGRATALTHLLTGASCIGLEIQPGLVHAARRLAARLRLTRFSVVQGDAAELTGFMTVGTVFFLYCPFSGNRLARVLDALEQIARTRQIRVCFVDLPVPSRGWLVPLSTSSAELTVCQSAPIPSISACGRSNP
jgi:SAM-dependent methyltransferase